MHLVSISGMSTFAAHVGRNCRRCKPFSLNASKASLLVMTNWLMGRWICWWAFGHLSRRLVAWPGFGGCLQPRAPTPHTTTQPPNPPPRDPSVEQSPPSDAHPNCRAPALAEETKEKKVWLTRHLESHIKLQYERNGRVRNFFANFWHLSSFFNSIFEPFSSLYNRNHYPGPEVY